MKKDKITPKQTSLLMLLQSIGSRLHEYTERSGDNPEKMKSLFIDYKEFRNALEFYFANRVEKEI